MATMDGCAAMALRPSEARKQGPSSDEDPCAAPADPDADVTEEAALPKVEVHVAYQDGSPEDPEGKKPSAATSSDPQGRRSRLRRAAIAGILLLPLVLLGLALAGGFLLKGATRARLPQRPRFNGTATNASGTTRILVHLNRGAFLEDAVAGIHQQTGGGIFVSQRGSVAVLELPDSSGEALEDLERLRASGAVEAVEEDHWLYLEDSDKADPGLVLSADAFHSIQAEAALSAEGVPNDTGYEFQWNLQSLGLSAASGALMGARGAWEATTGSRAIKVCVIDSGVDYTHPDLVSNIWRNPGEIPGNGKDDDGNGFVDDVHGYNFADDNGDPMDAGSNGHGTHVAGIIGAAGNNGKGVSGVAHEVSIIACKFLTDQGRGLISDAVRCMDYCQQMGAHVTTSSAGDPSFSSAFRAAIQEATEDLLYVCSAGNDATDADVVGHYPSGFGGVPNMLTVAAHDKFGLLSGYSNWGRETIDIAAPGDDIWSTFPGNRYTTMHGSSMAVPHVSGAAALLLSLDRKLKPPELKSLLLKTAVPSPVLVTKVNSGGSLHIGRAIASMGALVEQFPTGVPFDLSFSAIHFERVSGSTGWIPCRATDITALPVSPNGGKDLKLSRRTRVVKAQLPEPFDLGSWKVSAPQVHANGVITFGKAMEPVGGAAMPEVAARRQLLPFWTDLDLDSKSEVSMKRVAGKTAFTFSNMVLGPGRATFQAVLHDDGDVTMAWLNAAPGAAKNQRVIVGISILTGSSAPPSSDLSASLPCSPGHLVPERAPQPPVVQVFGAWQPFGLVNRTVCYYHGMKDAPGTPPRGCVRPEATPELLIHPAGGLKALAPLGASGDWLPVKLLRGKKALSLADGEETNQVYVTGRGEISFSQPEAVPSSGSSSGASLRAGDSLSQESQNQLRMLPTSLHFRQPQLSVLASDGWERSGGLLVDHKQTAEALVVTLFQGPLPSGGSEPAVLAQATLFWDGMACVTYPSALVEPPGALLGKEVLVGASPGEQPGQPGFSWHVEALSLPSCTTQDTVRMPAEVFPAGTMFDLENRLLRFKPMGKSGMGVCVEKKRIEGFPVEPRARGITISRATGDLVVEELRLPLERRDFSRGAKFPMLGRGYSSAFFAANGYIAFDSDAPDQSVSEAGLHRTRRIAAMFADLNVAWPGAEVFTQQLPDRTVVTYSDVPLRGGGFMRSSNSFQVALHTDGRVDIAILEADKIANAPRAIGISGGAVPPGWQSSDLSASPACAPVIAEAFGSGRPFDLEWTSLVLRPKSLKRHSILPGRWRLCYSELPRNGDGLPVPPQGTQLRLSAQDSVVVDFEDGMEFPFLGTGYRHVHVASNGYLSFDQRQASALEGLSDHFSIKRISVFAADLIPAGRDGRSGRVWASHLEGRVVVTYENAELAGAPGSRATFQVELHDTGAVVMSWLGCSAEKAAPIVGISNGKSELFSWQPADLTDAAPERRACPVD